MDCIFCKIANGEVGSLVYEDNEVAAFKDLSPQAKTHILIVPKKHYSTLNEINEDNAEIIGKMAAAAVKIAKQENIDESGYRLTMNCNRDAGQTVFHIHLHLLGGEELKHLV